MSNLLFLLLALLVGSIFALSLGVFLVVTAVALYQNGLSWLEIALLYFVIVAFSFGRTKK